ncbi:MAG: hypothetical protein Q7J26_01970 [Brevundimonas sp.]|uniref:hypothetical protein n=1 Tax=Brevundimonas sp. TaxID=1871086 RepID=UPI00271D79A4|nr:hypothetical protein [Brevundimonas sp.]MDO9607265.1 hypothetical protein [Brevundimonas sp.]
MSRPRIDFVWLRKQHLFTGLRLVTNETPAGQLAINDDPAAFVSELIRLAEIGQKLEIATGERVKRLGS